MIFPDHLKKIKKKKKSNLSCQNPNSDIKSNVHSETVQILLKSQADENRCAKNKILLEKYKLNKILKQKKKKRERELKLNGYLNKNQF